jgi:WW domain-containing oxidoreductase
MEKAREACRSVIVPINTGTAIPFACEQTDLSSVVACAERVLERGSSIDMLICNAGVYLLPQLELAEGLEKQFVVNHLSHFLLVNLLLDCVKSANQGRVVVVGSGAYTLAPVEGIDFNNLSGQRYYDPVKMYGQSKLANGLFARELARRVSGTHVTSNVLNPGWVMTKKALEVLSRDNPTFDPKHAKDAKNTEQGAATTCYVATNPSLANVSGQYFDDCDIVIPGGAMRDDALAAKLWIVSERLTAAYLKRGSQARPVSSDTRTESSS